MPRLVFISSPCRLGGLARSAHRGARSAHLTRAKTLRRRSTLALTWPPPGTKRAMDGHYNTTPHRRPRPAAMADVARRAGVSHQTVSRVVNDSRHVRAETRQRVLVAMRE